MTGGEGAADVIGALTAYGLTIGTAESLTGGLLAATLTDVPGASATFVGSVVSYATRVKAEVLGVDAALLAERGAVDPDVARQMAGGVCRVLGTDIGVATTGVAGPDPQDGQPVGTVHVAVAGPGAGALTVRSLVLDGDRAAIRAATVEAALDLVRSVLAPAAGRAEEAGDTPR